MSATISTHTLVLTEHEAKGLVEILSDAIGALQGVQGFAHITEAESAIAKHDEELATALVRRLGGMLLRN